MINIVRPARATKFFTVAFEYLCPHCESHIGAFGVLASLGDKGSSLQECDQCGGLAEVSWDHNDTEDEEPQTKAEEL